ncbi:hypothetical protein L3Q82_002063 [Scortum barcoo]|uniref:Uncharacterized protein n=1 Tax=Scortum barcoo TaxID=214431 RepID=A0ACB8W1V7_9TELE|nr:hypothetical protein L3Q82_002063 [Scortum barcoo]
MQLSAICSGVKDLKEHQEELQKSVATQVNHLTAQLQLVITRLGEIASLQPSTPPVQPQVTPRPVRLAPPEKYSGESAQKASQALLGLRQGSRRVIDYAIQFCMLAADSRWNPPAIKDAFVNSLNEGIRDQLAPHESPDEFEDLVDLAVWINNCLQEREAERCRARATGLTSFPGPPSRRPGCTPSRDHREAMDEYIEASLRSGIIRPSSSLAEAGFFFVQARRTARSGHALTTALNEITVKNQYPLPLISSAFEAAPAGSSLHRAGPVERRRGGG